MLVELRWLGDGDGALLWEYLYLALFVPPGGPLLPRAIVEHPMLARYVAGWGRPADRGLLAMDSKHNRDIGAAWLRLWPTGETGFGFVDHDTPELSLAVRPEYRGQGVGTRLLGGLLADADRRHAAVSLSVAIDNPARRLYARSGFEALTSHGSSTTMRRVRRRWPAPE